MRTQSIWEGTAGEGTRFPPFRGDTTADVVVIGGGITGLTAAMLLSEAGKKVIVLEAMQVGLGTTGNSTGNLYVTVDEHLSGIRKKWNADVMKDVVQSRTRALDMIESTAKRLNIDCDFRRTSFNYFAEQFDERSEAFFETEFEALREAGLSPLILDAPGFPFSVKKIMTVEGQAQFHPLKYVRGLAQKIAGKCAIHEQSMVIDFDQDEGIVKTAHGTIRAQHVIMATHTPKGVFMVQTVLGPYREHGVAAELKSGSFPDGIYWGIDEPKHSVRAFRDGDKDFVMVVGDKYKTGQGENTFDYVARLEKFLQVRFNLGERKYIWGGQHYRAADGLPYIGKKDKLYLLTGFATDGLVYGTLAAMIVSDMIMEKPNPWEETYKLGRFTPVKSFKEFFRENVDNLGQYMKDTPWNVDATALDKIHPGEAQLIEHNNEKLAVYKDENGSHHIVSAVCTHMKCVVNWNPAEKTWDCPCHGSRFSIEGKVIEGPAITDLPHKKIENT